MAAGGAIPSPARPPALIPAPQKTEWTGGALDCSRYQIIAPAPAGAAVAELERALAGAARDSAGTKIELRLGAVGVTNAGAYTLNAAPDGLVITAPETSGLFYGVATARQLLAGTTRLPCCRIADAPAFAWRGFMHDVGRNFQDIALLNQILQQARHDAVALVRDFDVNNLAADAILQVVSDVPHVATARGTPER